MRQLFILFAVLVVTACEHQNKSKMEANTKTEIGTIEIVMFKTKNGVNSEEFIRAAEAVNPLVADMHGYLGRQLAVDPDGNWMDTVFWTDLESAERAAEEVMKSETCQHFFGMIDQESMKFTHFIPVLDHRKE